MIFATRVDPLSDNHCLVGVQRSWRSFEIFAQRRLDTKGLENGISEACGRRQSYDHSSLMLAIFKHSLAPDMIQVTIFGKARKAPENTFQKKK